MLVAYVTVQLCMSSENQIKPEIIAILLHLSSFYGNHITVSFTPIIILS